MYPIKYLSAAINFAKSLDMATAFFRKLELTRMSGLAHFVF
jgi:hypothetical protein